MPLYLREFARANLPYRSLADLIDYNRAHAAEVLPLFGQELFEQAAGQGHDPQRRLPQGVQRLPALTHGSLGIDAVLKTKRISALIAPTGDPGLADRYGQR